MDSILELSSFEARQIKETIQANKELFVQNAPQLFEDCFNLLLSTTAKTENFHLLKQLTADNAEPLSGLFNAVL
jgi:hypothetical protein